MLSKIPKEYRKPIYFVLVALAVVSLVLAVLVTLGIISDAQVTDTVELWLKYATAIFAVGAGILALKNMNER